MALQEGVAGAQLQAAALDRVADRAGALAVGADGGLGHVALLSLDPRRIGATGLPSRPLRANRVSARANPAGPRDTGREMPSSPRAPSVLTSWTRTILLALEARGIDPAVLVERAGLDPAAFADPDARFDVTDTAKLWRSAVEATGDPAFGLFASRFVTQTTFHALGYAVMASSTLREAVERNVRYGRLVSDAAACRLEEEGRLARVVFEIPAEQPVPADEAMDGMISLIARSFRALAGGDLAPVRVALRRRTPPGAVDVWPKVFRAPVSFGARRDVLEYPVDVLDRRLPAGNAELARMNESVVADYLERLDQEHVTTRVRALLTCELSSGEPSPDDVARQLGLSRRSLQRRLADEGTSFKALLNETRRDLAQAYLREGHTSITEVTFLLGFADTSSFSRAFKRWTGVSPREFARGGGA